MFLGPLVLKNILHHGDVAKQEEVVLCGGFRFLILSNRPGVKNRLSGVPSSDAASTLPLAVISDFRDFTHPVNITSIIQGVFPTYVSALVILSMILQLVPFSLPS